MHSRTTVPGTIGNHINERICPTGVSTKSSNLQRNSHLKNVIYSSYTWKGGQSRVPENDTAFAHRKTPFLLNIHTCWQHAQDDKRCLTWVKDFHDTTREFADGVYVNFLSQEVEARVKEAYTPDVWDRLVKIKTDWDPDNLFRMNQNIKPSFH